MKFIDAYRVILMYKDSCKLRDRCYKVFDRSITITEVKTILVNDWKTLLFRFPIDKAYSNLIKMFNSYADGMISIKEFYFITRSICCEVDVQIDNLRKDAEKAAEELDKMYDAFLTEGAKKSADENDDCTELLYKALMHHEVKRIFMELLEY